MKLRLLFLGGLLIGSFMANQALGLSCLDKGSEQDGNDSVFRILYHLEYSDVEDCSLNHKRQHLFSVVISPRFYDQVLFGPQTSIENYWIAMARAAQRSRFLNVTQSSNYWSLSNQFMISESLIVRKSCSIINENWSGVLCRQLAFLFRRLDQIAASHQTNALNLSRVLKKLQNLIGERNVLLFFIELAYLK